MPAIEVTGTKDATWALGVIARAANLQVLRLRRGLQRRAVICRMLEAGEEPTGSRVDWIAASARRVCKELAQCAREFNAVTPDDLISFHDMADVLATANGYVRSQTTEKK